MRSVQAAISPEALERLLAYRRRLENLLPGMVTRVLLFGSRARGDADPDSDFDVAVFLAKPAAQRTDVRAKVFDAAFEQMAGGFALEARSLPEDYLDPVEGHFRTELARRIAEEGVAV